MTWTKLSDDFSDDCWQLSDAAFRLHIEGLVWSNRKLLNLRIAKDEMRWTNAAAAVTELLAAGWWTDNGDCYLIRHHACYQRSRDDVLHQQEVNKRNRRKGKTRPVREQAADIHPDEPSDEPSDEMDRTGQDRPGQGNGQISRETFTEYEHRRAPADLNTRLGYR